MKPRVVWHLPYAVIGGTETLYAVILKFFNKDLYDHFVTCPTEIRQWCAVKFKGTAQVVDYSTDIDLANKLKSIGPNIIMGTHGSTLYRALDILQAPYPVIEIVHGSHIWVEHNVKMPKQWTRHVICVSNTAERVYLRNTKENIPTSVIINGVDTEVFKPVKPLQRQAKVISYMGRFLECDKHITKIINAFKAIRDSNARLYLVGGTPQEIVHLKHFARANKIEQAVKFFEHTNSPEKYFDQIDLFTVRSEAEGYCNSAAEALATGTPLVAYNFGGIIEHAPPGAIAVANTQSDYARLLRDVFMDYELRKKMRTIGLDFINREGNAEIMTRRYEQVIASVINSGPVSIKKAFTPQPKEIQVATVKAQISDSRPVVGVCNLSWHGIATATRNICDSIVTWYSDPNLIATKVAQQKPRAVLFSGMCPGFDQAMKILHKKNPEIPIFAYYHGGPSHYSFQRGLFGAGESEAFTKMLNLHSEGIIKKIAISSPGFDDVLRANGHKAYFCGNIVKHIQERSSNPLPGMNIGNWNRHHDHKHTSIGFAVAQLYPDARVHCLSGYPSIPGLASRAVIHQEMSQEALYQKYSQMTVNLQMSFIETFNISVMEMWACKRPVILGPGNFALVKGSGLEGITMVKDHTNPVAVKECIDYVLTVEREVISMQTDLLIEHNKNSTQRWQEFFNV